jgi:glycine/D-amino acid oxidase-like deaminating enzyme
VDCTSTIARIEAAVIGIEINAGGVTCHAAGPREAYEAPRAVLAAGAWVGGLEGLPRALPIEPLRGQMLAVGATDRPRPRHVVYGADAYLVPRGERVLVGATQERVGFDSSTTASALTALRAGAATLWPGIEGAPMTSSWAGLRPVTPDLLPILGPDPEYPSLVYACGHSRSGILMAPLTAECVADLIVGRDPPADLSPFRVERFEAVASKAVESRTGT